MTPLLMSCCLVPSGAVVAGCRCLSPVVGVCGTVLLGVGVVPSAAWLHVSGCVKDWSVAVRGCAWLCVDGVGMLGGPALIDVFSNKTTACSRSRNRSATRTDLVRIFHFVGGNISDFTVVCRDSDAIPTRFRRHQTTKTAGTEAPGFG